MSEKDVFNSINLIDDDLIDEAYAPVKKIRHIKIIKTVAIAAAILALLSASVLAANILLGARKSESYHISSYYTVPSKEKLQEDVGITPCIVEEFLNGYSFDRGSISDNEDYDTFGNSVEKYKGVHFYYKNDNNEISLHIDAASLGIQLKNTTITDTYRESELLYYSYINKLVPSDYKLTEEDKKLQKNGEMVFSYGISEVEIINVQGMAWEYQGLNYELLAIDVDITEADLAEMAKEVIEIQGGSI